MRLIIEARLADEDCDVVEDDGVVVVIERRDRSLSQLGLTLAERRSFLAKGAIRVGCEAGDRIELRADPLPAVQSGLEPQGQSVDGFAHHLRQSDGEEPSTYIFRK